MQAEQANQLRHRAGSDQGHYESYFIRANHPTRPLAFWIRYTIFSPRGRAQDARGELWAIAFDGERRLHVAVKQQWPLPACRFGDAPLSIEMAGATLDDTGASGSCRGSAHAIDWSLQFQGGQPTLLLLPERLYDGGFPKAKSLVSRPLLRFSGQLSVDGERMAIDSWPGSQNHNWGRQHTDRYAWAQVAGFDNGHDESFLEVASAKLRIGGLWTPWITPLVLRHRGREYALRALGRALRARAQLRGFDWEFDTADSDIRVQGRVHAERDDFVGLRYDNPPGGFKQCLNCKIASCELRLQFTGGSSETLTSHHRAAFEILTDDAGHGVALAC